MTEPTESVPALLALLHRERDHLIAQFNRIPVARRAEPSAQGGWSAAQIAEHCARVETGVAKMIAKGPELPRVSAAEAAAATITTRKIAVVRDRGTKVEAPERVHPTGAVSADAVLEQLHRSREAMLDAFSAADPAVLDGVVFPHPFIGPLTLRAWVELVAHHDARHAQQMAELA